MKKTTLLLGAIGLFIISGCGQATTPIVPTTTPTTTVPTTTTTTTPTPTVTSKSVSIVNFQFSPASVQVSIGGTVYRTNNDSVPHQIEADDGSFQSAVLQPGEKFSFKFTKAGTFAYLCTIHPSMKGTIVVK